MTTLASAVPEMSLGAQKFKIGHVTLTTPLLRVICRQYAWTSCVQNFITLNSSRAGDIIGAHQSLTGSRHLTTPLSGILFLSSMS